MSRVYKTLDYRRRGFAHCQPPKDCGESGRRANITRAPFTEIIHGDAQGERLMTPGSWRTVLDASAAAL